jgi:hypothetical protein
MTKRTVVDVVPVVPRAGPKNGRYFYEIPIRTGFLLKILTLTDFAAFGKCPTVSTQTTVNFQKICSLLARQVTK